MRQFGIGQPVRRVEDRRFLTGRGRYLDDIVRPRQAHAAMLRSPHAHARIRAIDTAAAAADAGRARGAYRRRPGAPTASARCRASAPVTNRDGSHDGDAAAPGARRATGCAMSATRSRWSSPRPPPQARDAAELIAVDYEPLPAVVDTGRGARCRAARGVGRAPGNLCFDWEIGDRAAAERGVAAARHRVSLTLVNNRVVVNSMEPRGAIGEYDPGEDAYTLWSSTQGSHFVRNLLAEHVFHVPENRIRVVTPDVGGGFGMKLFLYPEHVLVLWAAKKLGRPVKWIADRSEAFITDTQGRDNVTKLDLALDEQFRFLALRGRARPRTWAPICRISRRRSRPPRARSCIAASTPSRRSMSRSRASSRTPCRSTPIAAPAGRRRPTRSSG